MNETESDVDILLECLKCQKKDFRGMRRSLLGLASLFNSDGDSKEYFRRVGGLQLVHRLLFTDLPTPVLQASVYCLACAVENDVFCQNTLTKQETFTFLHKVFSERREDQKLMHAAVFFLLNLVASNSVGQHLAKESSVLADLLNIFKSCADRCQKQTDCGECGDDLELWHAVIMALGVCVNNPQNEVNQRLCSSVLPLCFQVVGEDRNHQLTVSLLSLAGLIVAGNSFNQKRVKKCGGLDILLQLMQQREMEGLADTPRLQTAVGIVSLISACIADNEENGQEFVSQGGIETVMRLLGQPVQLSTQSLLQLILTLGHALEFAGRETAPLKPQHQNVLLQLLADTDDEEGVRAVKYVLSSWQRLAAGKEGEQGESAIREEVSTAQRIQQLSARLGVRDKDGGGGGRRRAADHQGLRPADSGGGGRVPVHRRPSPSPQSAPPPPSHHTVKVPQGNPHQGSLSRPAVAAEVTSSVQSSVCLPHPQSMQNMPQKTHLCQQELPLATQSWSMTKTSGPGQRPTVSQMVPDPELPPPSWSMARPSGLEQQATASLTAYQPELPPPTQLWSIARPSSPGQQPAVSLMASHPELPPVTQSWSMAKSSGPVQHLTATLMASHSELPPPTQSWSIARPSGPEQQPTATQMATHPELPPPTQLWSIAKPSGAEQHSTAALMASHPERSWSSVRPAGPAQRPTVSLSAGSAAHSQLFTCPAAAELTVSEPGQSSAAHQPLQAQAVSACPPVSSCQQGRSSSATHQPLQAQAASACPPVSCRQGQSSSATHQPLQAQTLSACPPVSSCQQGQSSSATHQPLQAQTLSACPPVSSCQQGRSSSATHQPLQAQTVSACPPVSSCQQGRSSSATHQPLQVFTYQLASPREQTRPHSGLQTQNSTLPLSHADHSRATMTHLSLQFPAQRQLPQCGQVPPQLLLQTAHLTSQPLSAHLTAATLQQQPQPLLQHTSSPSPPPQPLRQSAQLSAATLQQQPQPSLQHTQSSSSPPQRPPQSSQITVALANQQRPLWQPTSSPSPPLQPLPQSTLTGATRCQQLQSQWQPTSSPSPPLQPLPLSTHLTGATHYQRPQPLWQPASSPSPPLQPLPLSTHLTGATRYQRPQPLWQPTSSPSPLPRPRQDLPPGAPTGQAPHGPAAVCTAEEQREWLAFQYFKKFLSSVPLLGSIVGQTAGSAASERSIDVVSEGGAHLSDHGGDGIYRAGECMSLPDYGDGLHRTVKNQARCLNAGDSQSVPPVLNIPSELVQQGASWELQSVGGGAVNTAEKSSTTNSAKTPGVNSAAVPDMTAERTTMTNHSPQPAAAQSVKCKHQGCMSCIEPERQCHKTLPPATCVTGHPAGHSLMCSPNLRGMAAASCSLSRCEGGCVGLQHGDTATERRGDAQSDGCAWLERHVANISSVCRQKDTAVSEGAVCAVKEMQQQKHGSAGFTSHTSISPEDQTTDCADFARVASQHPNVSSVFKVPLPKHSAKSAPRSSSDAVRNTPERTVTAWQACAPSPCTPRRKGLRRAPTRSPAPQAFSTTQTGRHPARVSAPGQQTSTLVHDTTNVRNYPPQQCSDAFSRGLSRGGRELSSLEAFREMCSSAHDLAVKPPSPPPSPSPSEFDCHLLKSAAASRCPASPGCPPTAPKTSSGKGFSVDSHCPDGKGQSDNKFNQTSLQRVRRLAASLKLCETTQTKSPESCRLGLLKPAEFRLCEASETKQTKSPESCRLDLLKPAEFRSCEASGTEGPGRLEPGGEVVPSSDLSENEEEEDLHVSLRSDRSLSFCDTESTSDTSSCLSEVYGVVGDSLQVQQAESPGAESRQQLCPGCSSTDNLDSRTFNIAIETSSGTCAAHRRIRQAERDFIMKRASELRQSRKLRYRQWKKGEEHREKGADSNTSTNHLTRENALRSASIFDFHASDREEERVSPPRWESTPLTPRASPGSKGPRTARRKRVPYTAEEERNLVEGVLRMGKHWQQVLLTYCFHPSRTAVDLMEKYKRMQKQAKAREVVGQARKPPLSMCEVRRLKRGVARYGHNWKAILQTGCFTFGRTAMELRDRWRALHR